MKKREKIAILGDSHASIYGQTHLSQHFDKCCVHQTDADDVERNGKYMPYLMNTLAQNADSLMGHYFQRYSDADYIMFVFGEPDVRIHFNKQINIMHRSEDEVIETLCKIYINKLVSCVPKEKIIIRYILPQRKFSMFGICNNQYVPQGTLEDRVRYTFKMNHKLKELCSANGILFFENIENKNLTNEEGELKDEYCDGLTHYNRNAVKLLNQEIDIFMKKINHLDVMIH